VPDNSTVVGIPGRIVKRNGERVGDRLDHTKLPDPVVEMLRKMQREIHDLKHEVQELRAQAGKSQEKEPVLEGESV
jgi:serine O-acetyltransferase